MRVTTRSRHPPRRLLAILVVTCALLAAVPAAALEMRVVRLSATATRVAATLEVTDLLRDRFLEVVQRGRAIFLQVEAGLWEDRRVSDRLAFAATPVTYRIDRNGERSVLITDQYGNRFEHVDLQMPVTLRVDMGPVTGLVDERSYYVHAEITAATLAERDIDRTGSAVFGEPGSADGLADIGRTVFRTLLRIGRYLDSASTEVTSDRVNGRTIRIGAS